MGKKKKKVILEADSSPVKGDVDVNLVVKASEASSKEDLCAENDNITDFDVANDSSSISYFSNSDFSDEEKAADDEYLQEENSSEDVCGNAPMNSVALNELCMTDVCENAPENNSMKEMESDPAIVSSLSPSAIPFLPGTIDALMSACGGLPHVRPANPPPPEVGNRSQVLSKPSVNNAVVAEPSPNAWSAPLPQVKSRRAPAIFPTLDEPEESYKKNGVISVDEVEAAEISSLFENVLVGRVVGKNFDFVWLESQLRGKWGAYKGFRVVDLGVGCFMLHFDEKESRDKVWLGGPWHVAGCLVGLDKWTGKFFPSMNPEMHVPTWIRAPGLPAHFWGEKTLKRIAKEIGEPLYIDEFTKAMYKPRFARFCVRRNLAKPLIGGVWLSSEATGDFFQKITYEDVTSICTSCGLAWHGYDDCKANKDKINEVDINNPLSGLDKWTLVGVSKPQHNLSRRQNVQQQGNVTWKQKRTQKQKQKAPANDNINIATIEKEPEPILPNDKEDFDEQQVNDFPLHDINLVIQQQCSLKESEASLEDADFANSIHHGECSGVKEYKKSKKRDKSCSNKVKTAEDYLEDDVRRGRSKSRRRSALTDSEGEIANVGREKKKSKSRARHDRKSAEKGAAGETPSCL